MNIDGHGLLHLLRAWSSEAMLGSVPGPQACLLCSLLPQGKVRVVVFMGLGTRQALGLGGSYLVPSP